MTLLIFMGVAVAHHAKSYFNLFSQCTSNIVMLISRPDHCQHVTGTDIKPFCIKYSHPVPEKHQIGTYSSEFTCLKPS